jgi:putative membrane protein
MNEEQFLVEELILRDHLALDRTRLANERTLLAYLRTALMLMVAGATAERVMGGSSTVIITGWLFVGLGVTVGLIGTWRFLTMQRAINRRTGHDESGRQ